jgi:pimeloyl-ACP methyl ester carboxylesterase
MKAKQPDHQDFIARDGVKVAFELYQNDGPTVLLMPTWSIVHSRHWKMQIAYLARHFRLITFDGRGNGGSDRPAETAAYADAEFVADAVAVLDATDTDQTVVVGVSMGGHWAALLAGLHPQRISGAVLIGASTSLVPRDPHRQVFDWDEELDTHQGWAKYNRHHWERDYDDFTRFFMSQVFSEPHSTKQREDAVAWALETDGETLIATQLGERITADVERRILESIRCPVLLIHGTEDHVQPHASSQVLAEIVGGTLVSIEGGGHLPNARDPVQVNLAIRRFVETLHPFTARPAAGARP